MDPHEFLKEVYRRLSLRHAALDPPVPWREREKQLPLIPCVTSLAFNDHLWP
jgi:hypothetical protein